jgi:hypothetical protein
MALPILQLRLKVLQLGVEMTKCDTGFFSSLISIITVG